MSDQKNFDLESKTNIKAMARDHSVSNLSREWLTKVGKYRYVYNWSWMGLPIIQLPPDIVATQEIIWSVKPTLIIETGVARGGSIIFNASQLALLEVCEGSSFNIADSPRKCIGIDIDIRSHNRSAVEAHPLAPMIILHEGSSIEPETIQFVKELVGPEDRVMVILDSNHTHEHVLRELELYSELVTPGSFLIVHDTGIETDPEDASPDREWGKGNNPMTAVASFLRSNGNFINDDNVNDKLLITSSPAGYLRRVN